MHSLARKTKKKEKKKGSDEGKISDGKHNGEKKSLVCFSVSERMICFYFEISIYVERERNTCLLMMRDRDGIGPVFFVFLIIYLFFRAN